MTNNPGCLTLSLLLLTTASAQLVPTAKSSPQIVLNGSLQEDAVPPKAVPNTRIGVGGGPGVLTDSIGQFSLKLTRDFAEGNRVTITVERGGWLVNDPVDGMWNLPSIDEQKVQTKIVLIVPKGSMKLWSDDRIQTYITKLQDELAKLKEKGTKPRPVSFDRYLSEWAAHYGFTLDQVRGAFEQWAQKAEESGSKRAKGLAEFYRKNFEQAATYFKEAALDLRQRREARDRTERLEEYYNWRNAGSSHAAAYKFKEALGEYAEAQNIISKEVFPLEWAEVALSIAYAMIASVVDTEGATARAALREAEKSCDEALTIYARDRYPVEWAVAQDCKGVAAREAGLRIPLGVDSGGLSALLKAVRAHKSALEVLTREHQPIEWAVAQQNLAIALLERGIRFREPELVEKDLNDAADAIGNALKVFTRKEYPSAWAELHYNRGIGLMRRSTRVGQDARSLLDQSIAAFGQAQQVYTESEFPREWARTSESRRMAAKWRCIRFEFCVD
jgi:tetratricopeptide (TPR) repeat protein